MDKLIFQVLAIRNNQNLPNTIKMCQSKLKILANVKSTLKNGPKTIKILSKWWNFAKSGHSGYEVNHLLLPPPIANFIKNSFRISDKHVYTFDLPTYPYLPTNLPFTGVTIAHGPIPHPTACRYPLCSLMTATYIPTYLGNIHQMTFNYILRHEQVEVMSEVGQF